MASGAAPTQEAYDAAVRVLGLLADAGQTLATCESLTGGLLGASLTSVPGASAAYRGGLVTYATDLKHVLAGVDQDDLDRDGAVAPGTALAMASGARERCLADWAVAVTGVAGPDEQEGRPAGTVFVAVARDGSAAVDQYRFDGDRHAIRSRTVEAALRQLERAIATG
ncbi:competence/damage-inducible protein cinA [Raineyella antarctica]|uniref:Competence/damage-inducible protein cinA n=1 Tax=Raineyella antarctica TaxID=1577474 RepID=A0A1G6GR05_9ACTN|nr:CinA family protein [Raineyella antarctica]SDB84378.1 competence/damage-inducible protein cinA [Raineyella antarctica]